MSPDLVRLLIEGDHEVHSVLDEGIFGINSAME
jgi:hypothetical protein